MGGGGEEETTDGRLWMRDVVQGKLEELGQNGRAFAMEHFSKAKGVLQLGAVIERQARIGS